MSETTATMRPAPRDDWFDATDAQARIGVAEEAMLPLRPMERIGEHWGEWVETGGIRWPSIICVGDERQMWAVAAKRRHNRLFRDPEGNTPRDECRGLRPVAERLPIWC